MAKSETSSSITQLTATGDSTEIDVAGSYDTEAHLQHANGTGTITSGATVVVEYNLDASGGTWRELTPVAFGTTASTTEFQLVPIPSGAKRVRFAYTAPVGSTGHTFDAAVSEVTFS